MTRDGTAVRAYRYVLVDVFSDAAFRGVPLAVFPDAAGLDEATMRDIMHEVSPYLTAFVLPRTSPTSDWALRMFTIMPNKEWVFAGHPTIGAALVRRGMESASRRKERITIDEPFGAISVRFTLHDGREFAWFVCPRITFGPIFTPEEIMPMLDLQPADLIPDVPLQAVSAGVPHLFVPLRTKEAVDGAVIDMTRAERAPTTLPMKFFLFTPTPAGAYARMYAPHLSYIEDPATGVAAGPLAAFMMRHDLAPKHDGARWICEQGVKIGRRGEMHLRINGNNGGTSIEVGGTMAQVGRGMIEVPLPPRP